MGLTLRIPNPKSDSIGESILKLVQISKIVNSTSQNDIIIDYSNAEFQYNAFISGMHIFIKEWERAGKKVTIRKFNQNIEWYMDMINFPFDMPINNAGDLGEFYTKTFTPIIVFPTEENKREICIQAVLELISNQNIIFGKDHKNILAYFISELTNNVADHSQCDSGTIFVQTYPQKGFIDISIADNGVGIFDSYNKTSKYKPRPVNEPDSIDMAVNGKSTKDRSESRGFGLSTSRDLLINGLGGKFAIWSGESMFVHTSAVKGVIEIEKGAFLKGCFLTLRFPINVSLKGSFYDYLG